MAKQKTKTPGLKSLKIKLLSDAWAVITTLVPAKTDPDSKSGSDVILQVHGIVGVLKSGSEKQIDVLLVSYDARNLPVASSQCALQLLPGVSVPVVLQAIHHHAEAGTYSLRAFVKVDDESTPIAEFPATGDTPWTYRVD